MNSEVSPVAEANASPAQPAEELSRSVGALVNLGRLWASHGLRLGRIGLQHSAKTLELAASTLEAVAQGFDNDSAPAPHETPVVGNEAS
jgi:hypothetical protein